MWATRKGLSPLMAERIWDIGWSRSILDLQPADATDHTLLEALAALLAETRAHALLETELSVDGTGAHHLPAPLAQGLLQIAREAMVNTVRHARAGCLRVTLDLRDAEVHMRIVDNGVGFDTSSPPPPGHDGLRNLHERAHGLGGAAATRSALGQGTAVDVRVPVVAPEREGVHV